MREQERERGGERLEREGERERDRERKREGEACGAVGLQTCIVIGSPAIGYIVHIVH